MRQILIDAYLDWRNNYLFLETYAEHNGITKEQAEKFLALAKEVFDSKHPDA